MATNSSLADKLLAENFATLPTRRSMAHVLSRGPQPSDDVPYGDVTSLGDEDTEFTDWDALEMDAEDELDDIWQRDDVRRIPVESRRVKA